MFEFLSQNSACQGSVGASRNGTCFTAEECSEKGGLNGGACAEGYGICCIGNLLSENYALCYRNFQNVKLRLDFGEIW